MPIFNSVAKRKLFLGIILTGGGHLSPLSPQVMPMLMMVQLELKYVGECAVSATGAYFYLISLFCWWLINA
jgi:hypothetical protein